MLIKTFSRVTKVKLGSKQQVQALIQGNHEWHGHNRKTVPTR